MTSGTANPAPQPRPSDSAPREGLGIWPLDAAFAILGLMVIGMVAKLLRFDDPRWIFNAWTYALGVPTVLIATSMLVRAFASEQVERSIQIGFLISVVAHLFLMLLAVNVILFSGMWPDATQEIARQMSSSSRGNQFIPAQTDQVRSAPDYLRPVPSELTQPSRADIPLSASVDSRLDPVQQALEASVPDAIQVDRAPVSADQPEIVSKSKPIERPPQSPETRPASRAIDIPSEPTRPTETSPIASIQEQAQQLDAARIDSPQQDSMALPSGSWLPEPDINKSMRQSMPGRTDRASLAANADREPILVDRSAQPPARTLSANRSLPRLEGVKRPIEIPTDRDSKTEKNAEPDPVSMSFSAGSAVLDRTDSTELAAAPAPMSNSPASARALDAIPAVEPSMGAITGRTITPSAAVAADIDLLRMDNGLAPLDINKFRRQGAREGISKTQVAVPAPAFKQRMRRNEEAMNQDLQAMGALGPKTEEAIERGLEFLARHQREDGSWRLEDFGAPPRLRSDTAATALALLSFQGAGYSHEQFKYQQNCRRAIDWLLANQKSDGDLYRPMDRASDLNAWLYSHSIAALALCEAYGMTQDESIRQGAQRSIDFLVASQDPIAGGWRYSPRVGSDTSVTGWGMMALKSAELAGLQVPPKVYVGISKWLNASEANSQQRYLYRYNWQANTPEAMHGRIPTPVMTSVGLLMRFYLGWHRATPEMQRGTDSLLERPPSLGTAASPQRDTYYWYYASQVMFHMGGERWQRWYSALYPILIESQETEGPYPGSWNPAGDIPDTWGPYAGRLYVTTLNLLSLEVTYRHLPIFEAASR